MCGGPGYHTGGGIIVQWKVYDDWRRGGGKGERSGQRASEGRVRDRGMDLPANLGFPNQQVKIKNPEDCTLNLGEERRVGQGMYLFRNSNLGRA